MKKKLLAIVLVVLVACASNLVAVRAQDNELPPFGEDQVIPVDFLFTGTFSLEMTATMEGLVDSTCYSFWGGVACIGEVPDLPGYTAAAVITMTQPNAAVQTGMRIIQHLPPKGERYIVQTHGGIAGGGYHPFVDGAPSMQPGDSLAAAGACAVNTVRFQPYLTQGYVEVHEGERLEDVINRLYPDMYDAGTVEEMAQELFEYNKVRLRLDSPDELGPGVVLLTPETWEPNAIVDMGLPYGGTIVVEGQAYGLQPQDPCIYLSPEALDLRDAVLAEMPVEPLPQSVIEYRSNNFPDARSESVVYASDWKEGSGWSWYGDPWIIRFLQTTFHVAQGDMETYDFTAAMLSNDAASLTLLKDANGDPTTTVDRVETDELIFRTSSDPPDMYHGQAIPLDDFLADPAGTVAAARAAYMGQDTRAIPFIDLITFQSAQFRDFNFTAAQIAVARMQ
jgi:hypothetical protein